MPNLQKKLASNPVLLTVVDFTRASNALVAKELEIIKGETDLCLAYSNLNPSQRKKSLIYRSLKKVFNPSIYRYENDKENTEDIVSEALCLLKEASIKFFEKNRDYNFEQFAVVYIREGIKGYRSKWNNLNGSNRNELIHSAIRAIKNKNCKAGERLNYLEAKHLAKHFNLCKTSGYKIIWELESLHFEKQADWKKVDFGDGEEEVHVTEIFKKGNSLPHNIGISNNIKSHHNSPEIRSSSENLFICEEKNNKKKIINQFKKTCLNNHIHKTIFDKRMCCRKEDELKLKSLSDLLGISIQRISIIEKNIKKKFESYYTVEKEKIEDIK